MDSKLPPMSALRIERQGHALRITLARPERRNAFDAALIAELTRAFADVGDARVVRLEGEGASFCAGADVDWQRAAIDLDYDDNVEDAMRLHAMFEAIDSCPAPVVARVQGHALGGGSGLLACVDVAIAAEDAVFAFSEVRLGIVPAVISPFVLPRIGPGAARRYFLTGERFDAATALRIGLVHEIASDLDEAVDRVVGELLKQARSRFARRSASSGSARTSRRWHTGPPSGARAPRAKMGFAPSSRSGRPDGNPKAPSREPRRDCRPDLSNLRPARHRDGRRRGSRRRGGACTRGGAARCGGSRATSTPDEHVRAAQESSADAIHPGYGFLAERASFAAAVEDAGLTWVGPPQEVLRAAGDKLEAKRSAAQAGVPVLPSGSAEEVGFPLLIKAAAGGGGRGMRVVRTADELDEALEAARREAKAGFGDETVFLERYLERPRHVEVQLLADRHGTIVHLGERDCSVQRRHQKVLEESPAPELDVAIRDAMTAAAVELARALGYMGAGTAEFVVQEEEFFFLELNARIQVEHAVTEAVTGVDLVEQQLRVASGKRLAPGNPAATGHAVEVRLYAEDPRTFLPQAGRLEQLRLPEGVRVDAGVETGDEVPVAYDPMIAKLVAHAETREEALDSSPPHSTRRRSRG